MRKLTRKDIKPGDKVKVWDKIFTVDHICTDSCCCHKSDPYVKFKEPVIYDGRELSWREEALLSKIEKVNCQLLFSFMKE